MQCVFSVDQPTFYHKTKNFYGYDGTLADGTHMRLEDWHYYFAPLQTDFWQYTSKHPRLPACPFYYGPLVKYGALHFVGPSEAIHGLAGDWSGMWSITVNLELQRNC